jgi:hypothetical protein
MGIRVASGKRKKEETLSVDNEIVITPAVSLSSFSFPLLLIRAAVWLHRKSIIRLWTSSIF